MQIAAHNPEFARKAGIPLSVAQEFHNADRRKTKGLAKHQYKGPRRRKDD